MLGATGMSFYVTLTVHAPGQRVVVLEHTNNHTRSRFSFQGRSPNGRYSEMNLPNERYLHLFFGYGEKIERLPLLYLPFLPECVQ